MHVDRTPYVLIVEDDPDILAVLELALVEAHYRVETAESGEEAVRKLGLGPPDVIVLDWSLPDMSGDELIAHMQAADPRFAAVRRVVMSGVSGLASVAMRVDAIACPKPCTIDRLVSAIELALGPSRPD